MLELVANVVLVDGCDNFSSKQASRASSSRQRCGPRTVTRRELIIIVTRNHALEAACVLAGQLWCRPDSFGAGRIATEAYKALYRATQGSPGVVEVLTSAGSSLSAVKVLNSWRPGSMRMSYNMPAGCTPLLTFPPGSTIPLLNRAS